MFWPYGRGQQCTDGPLDVAQEFPASPAKAFDDLFVRRVDPQRGEEAWIWKVGHTRHLHLQHRIFSSMPHGQVVPLHRQYCSGGRRGGPRRTEWSHNANLQEACTTAETLVLLIR